MGGKLIRTIENSWNTKAYNLLRVMRKVVDSNYLQDSHLETYLAADANNFVVLIDYVAMEAYKTQSVRSVVNNMSILSRYPRQVVVLKSTLIVCGLKSNKKGFVKRIVNASSTRDFGKFCTDLNRAMQGDRRFVDSILDHGKEAKSHLDKMLNDLSDMPTVISHLESDLTSEEIRRLRHGEPLNDEMLKRFLLAVRQLALTMFADHPRVNVLPKFNDVSNSFIFRTALCTYLQAIHWVSEGGAVGSKPERHRNDAVDSIFAAYATYFDGFLSNDKKAYALYQNAKYVLESIDGSWRFR